MNKEQIKKSFNKAKHTYDKHCQLQQLIGKHLIKLIKLHSVRFAEKLPQIIDLGCGTGIVTEILAQQINYQFFYAVDMANFFVLMAKKRLAYLGIEVYEYDFDQLPPQPAFDIIFANMSLHWSPSLYATLKVIIHALSTQGILAFSIPLPGTFIELQQHLAVNHFLNSAEIIKHLQTCGGHVQMNHVEKITLQFDSTLSALMSIKNVGANYVHKRNQSGLCGKSFLQQFAHKQLTYVIGYFIVTRNLHA